MTFMKNNPRLVGLTFDYPPMRGGVARYLSDLVDASDGNIEVKVPFEHPSYELRATSYDVQRVNFWWIVWPKWLPLIKRCLEIPKDKVILVSHVFPIGTAAWLSKFFGGPEFVVLFHGTDLKRVNSRWKKFLLNRICKNAKVLIANSQATAQALKRLCATAEPLILTPGLKPFAIRYSLFAIRQEFGINENAKVILSVARLVERKGIDTLIAAAPGILEKHPNTVFVVIGNGPYAQVLESLAEVNDVQIKWIKDANDEDVRKWYAAADVFCLPAREQTDDVEGFGIVFLEAAYAGLPVIAGKGWGTSEAVVDGETGYLIAPTADQVANKIIKLLDDPELAQRMGQVGRERVEREFKWEDRWSALANKLNSTNCHPERSHTELKDLGRSALQSKPDLSTSFVELTPLKMTKGDDIAVVIPCWNHAKELDETLSALEHQTLQPKEVVVVDDGSTEDDPKSIVDEHAKKLNLRFFRFDVNKGAPVARNKGADMTSAPYIIFLDADATLVPEALAKMCNALEQHPEIGFVYSNFKWGGKLMKSKEFSLAALRKMNYIHTTSLIHRAVLQPFDESLIKFQDWDLWLTLGEKGVKGKWLNETLFSITERKSGMSHWLPAFVHKLQWPILGWTPKEIKRYRGAETIIRKKHNI